MGAKASSAFKGVEIPKVWVNAGCVGVRPVDSVGLSARPGPGFSGEVGFRAGIRGSEGGGRGATGGGPWRWTASAGHARPRPRRAAGTPRTRRPAAAQAGAGAAGLPHDGIEALARGAGLARDAGAEILPRRRYGRDTAGPGGQAGGQGCAQAVAGVGPGDLGAGGESGRSGGHRRGGATRGLDAAALRAGGPSDAELDALHEQYTKEALAAGVFGAPSFVFPQARSSGARTGWNCWSGS